MDALTIERFLKNKTIKGMKLVVGEENNDNVIYNVNIIDSPDSYEWFTAGDFLLTTGYIYKDNPELQRQMIQELAEMNCAGIGVKIKRYWDEVPQVMIDEAKKVNFPIIEIPYVYSLAQVTNVINNLIYKRENSLLKKYRSIHEVFNQCSLEDGDFWRIVEIASELINNPVLMLDSHFNLLSYHEQPDNEYSLSNYLSLDMNQRCFPFEFTNNIPTSTDKFTLSIKRKFPEEDGPITIRIIPIAYANDIYGYILAWETVKKLEVTDYVALETAATTAAIKQIKMQQLQESRNRMRDDFFDDLIQNRVVSIKAVDNMAEVHGLDIAKDYVIAIIQSDDAKEDQLFMLLSIIEETTTFLKQKAHTIKRQNSIIVFIELSKQLKSNQQEKVLRSLIDNLDVTIKSSLNQLDYRVGVGNVCHQIHTISKSYSLALESIKLSKKVNHNTNVFFFNDMMGYHLLDQHINNDQLKQFYTETLGELHDYDVANDSELITTLDAYFKSNANVSEAAKTLFVHRNTFIYRIEKIKKILDTDFKDAEENFNIQIALHIKRILNL